VAEAIGIGSSWLTGQSPIEAVVAGCGALVDTGVTPVTSVANARRHLVHFSAEWEGMKVLVAYASKRGSTAEIAEVVAATLRRADLRVCLEPAAEVRSLEAYDAVVLGSAVYMKRWRGDARHFLKKHRKALRQVPFWVFSSGPVGDPAKDNPEWMEPPHLAEKVEELGGRDHVVFGGCLPAEPQGAMERAMFEGTPKEHRDRRDWGEIRAWAGEIAAALVPVNA
jgi:menaquinone-dependent protoporphyrinogen oxidase